ncbi:MULTISPECIES: NAD(P)/FAD-dependent oxidoreductase [Microbacterium]|uniref:NAD(P)/FAD-dependent oxidoreductase n=1 Tax=Microbacterium TaxID=33882 RepID=UPI00278B7256|nr:MULTISPECIES: FAD-dependent oxidoreductase [Microbacterium]MDQ1074764.1 3-phenylpropionate/trans-cinnamate dioxygenase ferredoxin reductase subunit [Microbacterium sp. SORGH_AS_0969]MDQ1114990.1 3-phenylpropionate/trans-cinnamate dioxygenase ferredoxin reductase subunit [Microbacterium testaceum]
MTTTHFDHLIVGGGMVADTAARGIRELDADGSIGILSDDVDAPYTRPALSKKLWTDDEFTWEKVPLGTADDTGADIRLRTRVTAIRPDAREVDADGQTYTYGTLLLATGGKPVPLPIEDRSNGARALTFRTAEDYRRLRSLADEVDRIAVVGGGYIGSELAAALVQNGVDTVLIHTGAVLGDAVFPAALAERFEKLFRDAGVEIVAGSKVAGGDADATGARLELENGDVVRADAVVSGLGIEVATDLAEGAGLIVDDGIIVDAQLRTSTDGVWAAGDVASYPDRILGRRRVEHVDNANEQGRAAGRNLAGAAEPYTHTPYYYSAVFGIRYEAVGTLDAALDTVEDWIDPERGIVYYLDDDRVVGVLLWNVEDARDAARKVLAEAGTLSRDDLAGRIR